MPAAIPLWQRSMIGLARSPATTRFMQSRAALSALARRFVAGASVEEALSVADALAARGLRASLFYLGEYVADPAIVVLTLEQKLGIASALAVRGRDVHVSVDPTQIGFLTDPATGLANLERVAAAIRPAGNANAVNRLMIDMEDHTLVEPTLVAAETLASCGHSVAQTLQAYLLRTPGDLDRMMRAGIPVRLVKGAFAEGPALAHQGRNAVRQTYRSLAECMLSPEAREIGFYPSFATHDEPLIDAIRALAKERGWRPGDYEFEMLYGVAQPLQHRLVAQGERLRLYLPFGRDWWPYAVRRVGENPRNGLLLLRAALGALGR
jgi:proline dehydrogenase